MGAAFWRPPVKRRSDGVHQAPTPDYPLFAREHSRANFNESRQHVKDRSGSPLGVMSRTKATLIQGLCDLRQWLVLNDHFEHDQERLFLLDVLLELQAVLGNLEAIRRIFRYVRWIRWGAFHLPLPDHCYRLPTLHGLAVDIRLS